MTSSLTRDPRKTVSGLVAVLAVGGARPPAAVPRAKIHARVAAYAQRLADAIGPSERFILGGPGPAPLEKTKQDWRFQITLRGASAAALANAIRQGLAAARLPAGVSIALDVDALNSL